MIDRLIGVRSALVGAVAMAAGLAQAISPPAAQACAVCFGDPEAPETKAMAAGILVLLGCITTVLAMFAATFCYWAVRSHRLALANEGTTN